MCKLKCILCCLAFFALNCYKAKAQHSSDILWYKKSAINFNEALPVGNGRMGAMIYGRVRDEYISLNESTLWSGDPDIKWNNPDAKKYLPLVREAALKGEYKKADSLCKFMQGPYTESYMPMADLFIRYHGITDSLNYKRTLNLDSAIAATILITSATSFNGFNNSPVTDGKDASLIGEANMHKASVKSYTTLLKNHIKDYKSIYERVDYDFGLSPNNNLPTDERLKKMPEQFDANLLALICQYGRYILIASSKPGGQPSNLKGLRNEKLRPEYSSNWCIDHDAQMSYYPVETNNLSELHQPFLQIIKELSENGYQTAGINYGMRGWVAHHNTDIWRKSSPVGNWGEGNPHWANWNMSGAWLCENYFEHYRFTLDTNFLRIQAYPIMRGAAQFYLDWLIPDSTGKYLISVPSFSPENILITENGDTAQTSVNSTSDIELLKDLFHNIVQTAKILNIQNAFIDSVQNAYAKLAPYPIGKNGNLLEWSHDWRSTDPAHRHLSHMYAVFPGSEISPLTTPQLATAAKKALTLRAKTNGSWGFAWKAACWARLYEGDSAMQTLQYQLQYVNPMATTPVNNLGLYPNLFNSEVPAVILNGNTCITTAVTEMLLQSHTGIIDLLPALPSNLPQGSVKGLVARGDFAVSIDWNNHQLTTASLTAKQNIVCKIKLNNQYKIYLDNKTILLHDEGSNIYSFNAKAGKTYLVKR